MFLILGLLSVYAYIHHAYYIDIQPYDSYEGKSFDYLKSAYSKDKNLILFRKITREITRQENPDYDKLIYYYDDYLSSSDWSDSGDIIIEYLTVLYNRNDTQNYFKKVDLFLSDKRFVDNCYIALPYNTHEEKEILSTYLVLIPLLEDFQAKTNDWEFALTKLAVYEDSINEIDSHTLFFYCQALSKTYKKLNQNEKSNYYKNVLTEKLTEKNKNDEELDEIINSIESFINS